jgi:hypothetical protein
MFIIAFVLLAISITGIILTYGAKPNTKEGALLVLSGICTAIFTAFVAVLIGINGTQYCRVLDNTSKLSVIKQKIEIQQTQVKDVLIQLQCEVDKYLKHENSTLTKLTPQNVDVLLVQYPQLASAPTVTNLMDEIRSLNKAYYDYLLQEQDFIAELRFIKNNVFYGFSVEIPESNIPKH